MGRTHAKKIAAREERLRALPQSERLAKSALIKKKEGRILDAAEKHALRMSSDHGSILMLWEQLRKVSHAPHAKEEHPVANNARAADTVSTQKPEADDKPQAAAARATVSEEKKKAFEHKYPIVQKLLKLIEPKAMSSLRTPSISRVVQSMIKYGSPDHLTRIFKWLSGEFVMYASDAYAHFVVTALIRHSTHEMLKSVLRCLLPAVHQLVTNKYGIEVIHAAYSSHWCGAMERDLITLSVLKDNISVMKTWAGYPSLPAVLERNANIRKRLLTRLFDLCDKMIAQKDAIAYPFVQKLTLDYLRHGTREEVSELCDTLRPHVVGVASDAGGALLCSLVFTLSEPRNRKDILLNVRPALGELCVGKYSAPVLAHIFDYMYDVQLLNKFIVNDLVAHLPTVLESPHGYRILVHLLTPHLDRKQRFLLPHWFSHNLYYVENDSWNHHGWLNASYETEVVEVCSRSAQSSHLAVLPTMVNAFVQHLSTIHRGARGQCEKDDGKGAVGHTDDTHASGSEATVSRAQREHCAILAREILHVIDTEAAFRTALQLSPSSIAILTRGSAAQGNKRKRAPDEDLAATVDACASRGSVQQEGDAGEAAEAKLPVKKTKRGARDDTSCVRSGLNREAISSSSSGSRAKHATGGATESKRLSSATKCKTQRKKLKARPSLVSISATAQ